MSVVIPCYRVASQILDVIAGIGEEVDVIYVIDDACPEGTAKLVREECGDQRVVVLTHDQNLGVGGATISGYRRAIADGAEIVVKLDGDGQMDPANILQLTRPISEGLADYTKGNRFFDPEVVVAMPKLRLIGNAILSLFAKFSTGYWDIFDPNNGFTAISAQVLKRLPLDKISEGYFFESDMLFRLNSYRAVVTDIPMPAIYGTEKSGISLPMAAFEFFFRHWINTIKRIVYNYFLRDFSIATLELALGLAMLLFGVIVGGVFWWESISTGVVATAGQVMLAALPVIVGIFLLLSFLNYDIRNVPRTPLRRLL
ncbi:MAG: glycosyltransferase family 2 protein [Pirellulaceae bacterium]|nr:glycosyltransferase family 2 protein [Pirellulaceae bacterium]